MSLPLLTPLDFVTLFVPRPLTEEELARAERKRQARARKTREREAKKARKREAKEGALRRKTELKHLKDQPAYELAAENAESAEEALLEVPGAEAQREAIHRARMEAIAAAGRDDYTGALTILTKAKIETLLETGRAAGAKAATSAEKAFPAAFSLAKAITNRAADAADITRKDAEACQADVELALMQLRSDQADDSIAADVVLMLEDIDRALGRRIVTAAKDRRDYETAARNAAIGLKAIHGDLIATEAAELERREKTAASLAAEHEYEDAARVAEAMLDRVEQLTTQLNEGGQAWAPCASQLPELLRQATRQAQTPKETCPVIHESQPLATGVVARLQSLQTQVTANEIMPQTAADLFIGCQLDVAFNEQRITAYRLLTKARRGGDAQIATARRAADAALDSLHDALGAKAGAPDAIDFSGTFADRLDGLEATWERTKTAALKPDDLDPGAIVKQIDAVATEIGRAATSDETLWGLLNDEAFARARAEYDEAEQQCSTALAALTTISIDAADALGKELATISAAADKATLGGTLDSLTIKLQGLAPRITTASTNLGKEGASLLGEVTDLLADIGPRLDAFKQLIAEKKKEKDYGAQRDELQSQFDQQKAVSQVGDVVALGQAKQELTLLAGHVKEAYAALQGGKDGDGLPVTSLRSLGKDLAALVKKIGKPQLKTYLGATQAGLQDKADQIKADLPTAPLSTTAAALEELATKVDLAQQAARTARTEFKAFEKEVATEVKTLAGRSAAFADAPDYFKQLQNEMKGCKAAGRVEGELANAKDKLAKIKQEVDAAAQSPDQRGERQAAALKARQDAENVAAKWKGTYDTFLKNLKTMSAIPKRDRKEIEEIADHANEVFEAHADWDAAMMHLRVARDRAALLEKYPGGMEVSTRNNLPKVAEKWRAAVAGLKEGIDDLADALRDLPAEDLPDDARAAALATLEAVKNLFNPVAFDRPVQVLRQQGAEATEMTAAREEALREVRRFNAYVDKDFRMLELARNTFRPRLRNDIVATHLALADLENNLLISL